LAFVTFLIAMLAMIGPFTIDTMFPAFNLIGADLGADTVAMQQVTSVYMLAFASMCLWHGPISDAIGRRPVILGALVVYFAASVVCAVAPSLPVLLAGRALQGFAAGGAQIISRTVIRDVASGPAAQRMMSQVNMIFAVAPAAAPIVGGWLLELGTWHVTFWFLVGLAVLLGLLVLVGLPETHPAEARRPLNVRGVLSSLRTVLSDPAFLRLTGTATFGFASQFIYIVAAPIIMLGLLGKGEQDFWMLFVPLVTGMMLGAFTSSRLAHRVDPLRLASVGMGIVIVAQVGNITLALLPGTQRLPWALAMPPLIAFGVQMVFPVVQLLMLDRFPTMRGAAASGQSFVQLLFNAVLAGAIAPFAATSLRTVAFTSAGFAVLGVLFWVWYRRTVTPAPTSG
jgi:DHA1 family bicyclomycin/chloramphenicol resistance-like MFS transporter